MHYVRDFQPSDPPHCDRAARACGVPPFARVEHADPRERLLMLYGVWVKCLPHQTAKRRLVEAAIDRCKLSIAARASVGGVDVEVPT